MLRSAPSARNQNRRAWQPALAQPLQRQIRRAERECLRTVSPSLLEKAEEALRLLTGR